MPKQPLKLLSVKSSQHHNTMKDYLFNPTSINEKGFPESFSLLSAYKKFIEHIQKKKKNFFCPFTIFFA